MRKRIVLLMLLASIVAGLPLLAAETTIQRGIDAFTTSSNGTTYIDFGQHPLPAGFFCKSSAAFTERVALKGLPLATGTPGQLWGADTVVERLDDASFDRAGIATTRLQLRALSMVSIAPVKTACGTFHVYVSLAGPQRTTTMQIYRTEKNGGNFFTPIAINARLTFIPVKSPRNKAARVLQATKSFTFPAIPVAWSFQDNAKAKSIGPVTVDTDGDLIPDTRLPGRSNFMAGQLAKRSSTNKSYSPTCPDPCAGPTCHEADGEMHCFYPTRPPDCYYEVCP